MSSEQNRAIAHRFIMEAWSEGNLEALDSIAGPQITDHNPAPGQGPHAGGIKQTIRFVRAAFPDWRYTIEDTVAEGDRVAVRWTARGTHQGEFMGIPPTGKQSTLTGINIFRIEDGRIGEYWHNFDMLGWLQQLGAISM
jgi:steroid delta-isomerase-like uncharacterized protein